MDSKRAQEIMYSPETHTVRFHGDAVWLEAVNDDKAQIRYLDSDKRLDVLLFELVEGEGVLHTTT
ncbi:MAG: small, acid-soluble spore protein, H family [Syntrophomonas sp.]